MPNRLADRIIQTGRVKPGDPMLVFAGATAAQMNELHDDIVRWRRLEDAVRAMPRSNEELFAWLREQRISLSPGPGVVLLAVRADLRKAAGIEEADDA